MSGLTDDILWGNCSSVKMRVEEEIRRANQSVHGTNWWLRIAQGAAFRVNQSIEYSRELSIGWADIAILIYKHLANYIDPESRNSYECAEMNLRALMIEHFGCISEDLILDAEVIENWFTERLTVINKDLLQQVNNWRSLPSSEIKKLRDLKNRLTSLEVIYKKGYLTNQESLSKWIQIKNELP